MKVISSHSCLLSILQTHQSCFFNITCSLLGAFSPWNDLTQTICDSHSGFVRSFFSFTSSGCLLWPTPATAAPHHCLSFLHSPCFTLFHRTCSYLTLDSGCLWWVICLPHWDIISLKKEIFCFFLFPIVLFPVPRTVLGISEILSKYLLTEWIPKFLG